MSRMQFSLRMMLAAVAAVGIGAALWTAEPSWQVGAAEFSLSVWILASAVILIAHSSGKAKAFWLGVATECILPTGIYMISVLVATLQFGGWHFDLFLTNLPSGFRTVLLAWAFSPIVGLLYVFTHWLFIRSAGSVDPKD